MRERCGEGGRSTGDERGCGVRLDRRSGAHHDSAAEREACGAADREQVALGRVEPGLERGEDPLDAWTRECPPHAIDHLLPGIAGLTYRRKGRSAGEEP